MDDNTTNNITSTPDYSWTYMDWMNFNSFSDQLYPQNNQSGDASGHIMMDYTPENISENQPEEMGDTPSETDISIDLNTLYNTIFPIGGPDNNNNYVTLTNDKISTVQLMEPSLAVEEFILGKEKIINDYDNVPYKYAYRIPYISINDMIINQVDICAFKLDYIGFLPNVMFEFMDSGNTMLSTNVPKDGSIIKVYIGGQGDELYYKPIRQDFVLTSIRKVGSSNFKYRVYGKLNIPYGYRKEAWAGGACSAMQSLFNIATWVGLGFATNFTKTNTPDIMNWTNIETNTYFEFIEDITVHACYSPNTFFTSFIDQYNVLNFVECHSLLSHGGTKEETPAMIYKCFPPSKLPPYDPGTEKTTENQLPLEKGDDPENNKFQRVSYYFISNDETFNGWSNYIESYQEISNSYASLSDGFVTHVKYSDSNIGNWGSSDCDFSIRPIDNLMRDPNTQRINSLNREPTKDSYIPLNLAHISNMEYFSSSKNIDGNDINVRTNVESFNNFGNVDTTNTFKQYYFAEVQNKYQMKCLKKCGLKVRLQNYNPAVTKFSRIWVDIYDTNPISNMAISKIKLNDEDKESELYKYRDKRNKNLLYFKEEDEVSRTNKNWPKVIYNRGLSGWYVVTEIEIDYDPKENNLKMNLTLNRIEYKPCFKSEYYNATAAIDKYKNENIPEDILVYG